MNKKENPKVIIIGCNSIGAALASVLSEDGFTTVVIDKNTDSFKLLSPLYKGNKVLGDAANIQILGNAGLQDADAVLIVTSSDNANILIAQVIKTKFNFSKVVARLNEPTKSLVYNEFDIKAVSVEACFSKGIGKEIHAWIDGEKI